MRSRRRKQVHFVYRGALNRRWRSSHGGRVWTAIERALASGASARAGSPLIVEALELPEFQVEVFFDAPIKLKLQGGQK